MMIQNQVVFVFSPKWLIICFISAIGTEVFGQISNSFSTTVNTNCNGNPCDYSGPTILINEIMLSPSAFDGSLFGGSAGQGGEWIELFNPDLCESIDISCYYLGNAASDGGFSPFPGGFVIPPGTVVPPAGFVIIRGINAPPVTPALLIQNGGNTIEIVVSGQGVCLGGGTRLWFHGHHQRIRVI
jgi:hypothetical protein